MEMGEEVLIKNSGKKDTIDDAMIQGTEIKSLLLS